VEFEEAIARLAGRVVSILKTADRRELVSLIGEDKAAVFTREHRIAQVAAVKPARRRTRSWPRCSVEGCGRNVYMPSGKAKLCYQHHLEAGGDVSPLVKKHKERYAEPPKPEPPKKKAKPRTVLRKAGQSLVETTGRDDS